MADIKENKKRTRQNGDVGQCLKQRSRQKYSQKRKYHGKNKKKAPEETVEENNTAEVHGEDFSIEKVQTVNISQQGAHTVPQTTASSSKIVDIEEGPPTSSDTISGFRLIDLSLLAEVFCILSCPGCHGTNCLQLFDFNEKKKGLARYLQLKYSTCLYMHKFYTSKQVDRLLQSKNQGGGKFMEVNIRMVSKNQGGGKFMEVNIRMVVVRLESVMNLWKNFVVF